MRIFEKYTNSKHMMKRIIKQAAAAAAVVCGLIASSSCSRETRITGTLFTEGTDSIGVYITDAVTNEPAAADTIVAVNGTASIDIRRDDDRLLFVYILPLHQVTSPYPVFLLPGDRLRVSGKADAPEFRGSEIYDGLAMFDEYISLTARMDSLFREAGRLAENDIIGQQSLNAEYSSLTAMMDSVCVEYVKNNPDNLTSGYLTAFMNAENGLESYNLLGPSVKESALGEFLDTIAGRFTDIVTTNRNRENIRPGKAAPEFSLKGMDGKEYSLSSFRGKYVLLDFWGEWCYWCMKGMPDMKKYYAKYHDSIEFVGINCRDSEETWKKTVEENGLDWTNLYNGDDTAILKEYAVEGFPTKILIDKDGKIVEVFVGESEELYEKLDEMF